MQLEPLEPAQPPAPRATQVTIALNVAAFLVMVALGVSPTSPDSASLLRFGANHGVSVVLQHEWWRPLTSMFIHVGVLHLAVNMYSLWQIGTFVERLLGRTLYAVIYLLTGLGGAFASILWNPLAISAGASGAIFGLFGVIVGFTIRARNHLAPGAVASLRSGILATIGFNLVFAVMNPFIDSAAHVGGLVAGALAGFMATSSSFEGGERKGPKLRSQVIVLALVVGLAVLAATRTLNNSDVRLNLALQTLEQEATAPEPDLARVTLLATEALKIKDNPSAHTLRGWASVRLGALDAGLSDLDLAVSQLDRDPKLAHLLPDTLNMRGRVYAVLGDAPRAGADFDRSLKALDAPQTHALRAQLRMSEGRYLEAVDDYHAALERLPDDAGLKNDYAWALVQLESDLELALKLANESVGKVPRAISLGTRCWVHVLRKELDLALDDCRAAVEKGAGPVDQGMLAFLEGDFDAAIDAWEAAQQLGEREAREIAPWLERARAR